MTLAYHPLRHLNRSANLLDDFSRMLETVSARDVAHEWSPPAQITATEGGYRLELDVPGIDRDQIEIALENRILSVSGERKAPDSEDRLVRSERLHGQFKRQFSLPKDIDENSVSAQHANGVLSITIERAESQKPRRISIAE